MPTITTNPAQTQQTHPVASLDQLAAKSKERVVWLRVGHVIDGLSNTPLHDADVLFDAHSIRHVGQHGKPVPAELLPPGQSAPDFTLTESTLLPTLIEAHAHLFLDGAPLNFTERENYLKESPEWLLARGRARWPKILQFGVGTVRDAGDKHAVGLALAAEAKTFRGKLAPTPYIDSPGAAIHHRGRYGSFMGKPIEEHASLADVVASRVAEGADRIKLLVSGIINFKEGRVTTAPQMSIDEVRPLVAAAAKYGRQTFAHASGTDGVEHSIEGGVTTVEHGFFLTDEQLAKMRDKKIGWVPTFAPVQSQIDFAGELGWSETVVGHLKRIIEAHQKMLVKAEHMGVTVVAGSDAGGCGVPHGLGFLQELFQMEQAGMSSMAILKAATGISAATLNFAEPIGRIALGHRTRMILTTHNPLVSVVNLQKPKTILFDGTAIHSDGSLNTDGL